ncbi:RluA family pseudouridine synthase [Oceanicella actignis]|uniref:RluA family pseudouridine synthase n=1 Tax=Oceanicella actignis TaxID=1189325 RepID=UPI0011E86FEF|nr:RluA family pseudouridine synthase [Oceanicella actignis]TYO91239.1 ribosomal large subunit pseudouridine synthase A [Oceanicella actignis]
MPARPPAPPAAPADAPSDAPGPDGARSAGAAGSAAGASAPVPPLRYAPPQEPWLPVLLADDDALAVDKPAGLLTVPGRTPDLADCAEARARRLFPGALIVHRLDMDTSGALLMARNRRAQRILSLQFERRHVRKAYIARVRGQVADEAGEIDLPLICDWPNRPRQMVDHARGKPALTRWRVLAREDGATRLLLEPLTGRSHQLRVHMLAIGHPILGDRLYGGPEPGAERLQLHAWRLDFRHPRDGAHVRVEAPCPF